MRIGVCGAGIGGLTTAWWLARGGHEVTVLEGAPGPRTGGWMIDFFGSGWDVAERMGLLPALEARHYPIPELAFVNDRGRVKVALPYAKLRRWFDDRHFNFMRGDLEEVLLDAVRSLGAVELRFGARIADVRQDPDSASIILANGGEDRFDAVVGADGVRSTVRSKGLGITASDAVRPTGLWTAAFLFEGDGLRAEIDGAFRTLTVPDRQVALYPIRGGRLATFFVHRAPPLPGEGRGDTLRRVYGDLGWIVPQVLDRMPPDAEIYLDSVDQVVLDRWFSGRVVLVGDACQAPSLLAGQGASMAMGGGWALARELRDDAPAPEAFARYQARLAPAIARKQAAGRSVAEWFAPRSRLRIGLRNLALRVSTWPGMSFVGRSQISDESVVA